MQKRRDFLQKATVAPFVAAMPMLTGFAQGNQSPRPTLRFAVASDGHYGQPNTPYQRFHTEAVRWLNWEKTGRGLDFVLFNGDIIHDDPVFLPEVKTVFDTLDMPYYVSKGNHDMVSAEAWEKTWGYPPDHSFVMGSYGFAVGCTSNEKGEYLCADNAWLKKTLDGFADKTAVFVFLHISQRKWVQHGVDCPDTVSLLEECKNVAAVFHGHDHNVDNVMLGKKPFFFDGHFGGSWGTNYRGYRIVEITEAGKISTYQCNPTAFFVNTSSL